MGTQFYQLICENGHQLSVMHRLTDNTTPYCDKCGAKTISSCLSCKKPINGYHYPDGAIILGKKEAFKPSYCKSCSVPFPWTEQILNNAFELIELDEQLPVEIKTIIKDAIPNLLVETPTTPISIAKYKKYIDQTETLVKDGLKNLLIDVTAEIVKKSIW